MNKRIELANTAKREALKCFHGMVMNIQSNIEPIIKPWIVENKWSLEEADGNWCAAFVYYCCMESGFAFPIRPRGCISCNLAGCGAWEEWAQFDNQVEYFKANDIIPRSGDIVIYDDVFNGNEHDHIGIVLENKEDSIVVAEGNINNISGVVERMKDSHIRAYIRISNEYEYCEK